MQFITQRIHGALDYAVAIALIGVPLLLDFAAYSPPATVISIAAGLGLFVYSLLTDYSAGIRGLIPWRVHLTLDAVAAVALLAAPFALGFGGAARGFYVAVGLAVLAVVATTRLDSDARIELAEGKPAVRAAR